MLQRETGSKAGTILKTSTQAQGSLLTEQQNISPIYRQLRGLTVSWEDTASVDDRHDTSLIHVT